MSKPTDTWMPINIGDYLRDTQHLDATRHGCYLLWLFHYWVAGPLPNQIEDLIHIGKLRGPDAPSIAQALLDNFFTLESDGMYHQRRADIEKTRAIDNSFTAREKAVKASRARWKKDAPSTPQALLEDMPRDAPIPIYVSPSAPQHGAFAPVRSAEEGGVEFRDEANMIATAVIDQIGAVSRWARETIVKQARFELRDITKANPSVPLNEICDGIRDAMIEYRKRYVAAFDQGRISRVSKPMSAEKFFEDADIWKNPKHWGLKKKEPSNGTDI